MKPHYAKELKVTKVEDETIRDPWIVLADKYARPDDTDIHESLAWALEAKNDSDRRLAIDSLVALNDLYSASYIYWVAINGSEHERMAAVEVLGRLCRDTRTIHTMVKVHSSDKNRNIRRSTAEALEKNGFPDISASKF